MSEVQLGATDAKTIEYLLKKDLSKRMVAVQADRAFNLSGGNVGNAEAYGRAARALRKLLLAEGRQGYVPLRDITGDTSWLNEREAARVEKVGLKSTADLIDVLDAIEAVALVPMGERMSLTEAR